MTFSDAELARCRGVFEHLFFEHGDPSASLKTPDGQYSDQRVEDAWRFFRAGAAWYAALTPATSSAAIGSGTNASLNEQAEPGDVPERGSGSSEASDRGWTASDVAPGADA